MTAEHLRLQEARQGVAWRKWGPYLSERQWGTVREDYSQDGNAWSYFTHDQARSRAYRWGEDGLLGWSDDRSRLCFSLALWNERDPILKERLFGLTNVEGNHGEDVKEYYFYLDSTPTHSYVKGLYKYPQRAYPYEQLVATNRARSRGELEYELLDTGVFDDDRYWDVFVEYAKAAPEDILIRLSVVNRGPDPAALYVLPHLWFRNTWWQGGQTVERPRLRLSAPHDEGSVVVASHPSLGDRFWWSEGIPEVVFTENETNEDRLFGKPNRTRHVKDGINNWLLHGRTDAVDDMEGTRCAAVYRLSVPPDEIRVLRLRLTDVKPEGDTRWDTGFDATIAARLREADEFYRDITPPAADADRAQVLRQAMAGLLWSKQTFIYDLSRWLQDRGIRPGQTGMESVRNAGWFHMVHEDVISMPDKWEYPWYAAWDLAFHTIPLGIVDPDFANDQLDLMLQERYLHPNGQIPAYEWNFGDVNPPVHAWARMFNYMVQRDERPVEAITDLKHAFHKLLLNFTWWVNRKDRSGKNVFEGGFLGLDNIGVFDRSSPLPTGGYLEQADGTAWMAFYAQNMLSMALTLAEHDASYEDMAIKFYEHFVWIASAMDRIGDHADEMWDEDDGFFYDVLRLPDGRASRMKVRSMVGLLPLCAVTVYPGELLSRLPRFTARVRWFNAQRSELLSAMNATLRAGSNNRYLLSIMGEDKLRRVLRYLLDPEEFLGDYGIRSLSRHHLAHPYVFRVGGMENRVAYLPAESDSGMFGGNSNWRGPIWMPVNVLLIRALLQLYLFYGDQFRVECPVGSGKRLTLFEVAHEIAERLTRIFLRDENGRRPAYGGTRKFQEDPYWRDHILFHEYFHGDNGAGIGANHQTGWTALVAGLIYLFGNVRAEEFLATGRVLREGVREHVQR